MITRRVVDGVVVAVVDGERVKRVPSAAQCRKRLVEILETADDNLMHPEVQAFWGERARNLCSRDEFEAQWALACFEILEPIWDELTTPRTVQEPDEVDIFSAIGL